MCRRNTKDPLVRKFLDVYNLNLLPLPREGIVCGDVFRVSSAKRVSAEFALAGIVSPPLPDLGGAKGEQMGALAGRMSYRRELKVGLKLLEAFLAALSGPGLLGDVGAAFGRTNARSLS